MLIRPVDEYGDVLPVLRVSDLLKGSRATAELIHDRLRLLAGEWWENPGRGNAVLEMLKESRLTEADTRALASYITSYIRQTEGVLDVEDVVSFMEGTQFSCSCRVDTEDGPAEISCSI